MSEELIEFDSEDHQPTVAAKKDVIRIGSSANAKRALRWIAIGLSAAVVVLGGWAVYSRYFKGETPSISSILQRKDKKKDTRVVAPLDGTRAEPALAARNPLAVVIENHTDARPQSGLTAASVVFEAIAEGGITRFLAVYGPQDAQKIGPVRSARTYFVNWALGLGAYLAHVGGNIDALDQIRSDNVLDLDQFANGKSYHREPRAGLATEHTMFSDTKTLFALGEDKYGAQQNFTAYTFKEPVAKEKRLNGGSVTIDFSAPAYKVVYTYDTKTNTYKRALAGLAHKDALNGKQIAPVVVAVVELNGNPIITRINEAGWSFQTIGSGKSTIFQDGLAVKGTWKKTDKKERIKFQDENGKEMKFNPGQMWIEVISPGATFTYEEGTIATPTTKK